MLIGTASPEALAAGAPTIASWGGEAAQLRQVEVLQVIFEIAAQAREEMLPPALHPTNPPLSTWLLYRCGDSPWGSFAMAQTRIECRSGVRARTFHVASVVDNERAAAALASRWGFAIRPGRITLERGADGVRAAVALESGAILDLEVTALEPLASDDVQYIANMNLAHTPSGLRLVQVEPAYETRRAERGRPRLLAFDAAAWGEPGIAPTYPVAAALCTADVTLPPVRFVCRPDVLAFEGTESVAPRE